VRRVVRRKGRCGVVDDPGELRPQEVEDVGRERRDHKERVELDLVGGHRVRLLSERLRRRRRAHLSAVGRRLLGKAGSLAFSARAFDLHLLSATQGSESTALLR